MENTNRGLELIKKAIQEDANNNYTKAVELYEISVVYFNQAIQNGEVHHEKHRILFQTKCDQYLERVKKLKNHLEKTSITTKNQPKVSDDVTNIKLHRRRSDCIKLDCKICFSQSPESLWILRCQSSQIMSFF